MLLAAGQPARGARDDAPAAARGQRRDHARAAGHHAAHPRTTTCAGSGASRARASPSAGSIRTPAKAATSAREDRDVIAPAIERARAAGMLVDGPLPADTVFVPRALSNYDVVLAMYHDQGLPVLKHAGFGHAVNVTLGLPIVRTSVDHGTALDLAGTGRADAGSLLAATRLAHGIRAPTAASVIFARKRFGQHFLHDRSVLERIAREIAPRARRRAGRDRPGPRRAHRAADRPARARSTPSRSTATSPRSCARAGAHARLRAARSRRARVRFRRARAHARRAGCASSATCPTTSRRRCCSTSPPRTSTSTTCT